MGVVSIGCETLSGSVRESKHKLWDTLSLVTYILRVKFFSNYMMDILYFILYLEFPSIS